MQWILLILAVWVCICIRVPGYRGTGVPGYLVLRPTSAAQKKISFPVRFTPRYLVSWAKSEFRFSLRFFVLVSFQLTLVPIVPGTIVPPGTLKDPYETDELQKLVPPW